MKTETIQLKGKSHKEYIFNMAMELWEKAGWVNTELDDHIKEALKIHRETAHKAMIAEERKHSVSSCKPPIFPKTIFKTSCDLCKDSINKETESYVPNLCMKCWRKRYIQNMAN